MSENIKIRWLTDHEQTKVAPKTLSSQVYNEDGTLFKDTVNESLDNFKDNFASKEYVADLFKALNSNRILGFYCIEDVSVVVNGVSQTYPANSNVEIRLIETDIFEIIPTSDNSIQILSAFPGALGTYYSWLEGVKQFSNILFDMNTEDMYTKWSQGNQGAYQVQFAQYSNCIFWSDNPYINDITKRTNYTLCSTSQLPLCYSSIPDNTFKAFYLAFNVNSDPNWSNQAYKESFAKATWATQVFSYYGTRTIGFPGHDSTNLTITLPKDCRGLMFDSRNIENAGTFDAINVTNFGAKSGSWREAFGYCTFLRRLYIKNLKVNLNISWSPIDYESIYYIISEATNTNVITISVSPYTYNLLSSSDFELATSKNITIELVTTNYVEDKRLSDIAEKLDKTQGVDNVGKVMTVGEDGIITAKELPTQIQSDWNQNDDTSLDYIKNRTHYINQNETQDNFIFCRILAPNEFYYGYIELWGSDINYNIVINENDEAIVILNGTTYNGTYKLIPDDNEYLYIGNLHYWDSELYEDTGEPFCFGITYNTAEGTYSYLCIDENNLLDTYNIKVGVKQPKVFPLDEKFIDYKPGKNMPYGDEFVDEEGNTYVIGQGAEVFNDISNNKAIGTYAHAEGMETMAIGEASHAEGYNTKAYDFASHAEGSETKAYYESHAEGANTTASGYFSHAEGSQTIASGHGSHAEGSNSESIGDYSHAEGNKAKSSGDYSHAEGFSTIASGDYSHAEGHKTISASKYQHVQGEWNIEDAENKYAHIVGNGESDDTRSNAHTLDWNGNAEYQGDVKVNACGGENPISLVDTATALELLKNGTVKTISGTPTPSEILSLTPGLYYFENEFELKAYNIEYTDTGEENTVYITDADQYIQGLCYYNGESIYSYEKSFMYEYVNLLKNDSGEDILAIGIWSLCDLYQNEVFVIAYKPSKNLIQNESPELLNIFKLFGWNAPANKALLNIYDESGNGIYSFYCDQTHVETDNDAVLYYLEYTGYKDKEIYKITINADNTLAIEVTSIIPSPTTATVGQVLSVKAVNENNAPTEWETTSIPTKVSELENDSGFLTEQIQPDWNQNDEIAKDHIKNRTHYTYNAKTPILEANSLTIDSDGGYVQIGTLDSMLTIGETYYVTLNDITYECVAREYNDYGSTAIIGNGTIYGDGNEGNGEPFSCDSYTDGSIYLNAETAGTYNIKIEVMRETIKQLDEKYIADIVTRIYNDMAFNISSSSIRRFTTYIDVSTNEEYIVYVDNGTLVSERKITEEDLIDFTYTVEPDGSYTLLTWKGTLNGEPSTEIVIPNSVMINLIQEVK